MTVRPAWLILVALAGCQRDVAAVLSVSVEGPADVRAVAIEALVRMRDAEERVQRGWEQVSGSHPLGTPAG